MNLFRIQINKSVIHIFDVCYLIELKYLFKWIRTYSPICTEQNQKEIAKKKNFHNAISRVIQVFAKLLTEVHEPSTSGASYASLYNFKKLKRRMRIGDVSTSPSSCKDAGQWGTSITDAKLSFQLSILNILRVDWDHCYRTPCFKVSMQQHKHLL